MINENKGFTPLNEEEYNELTDMLFEVIKEQFCVEEKEGGIFEYSVMLQDTRFISYVTDDELRESAKLTIECLEELKRMNNEGFDRTELEKAYDDAKKKFDPSVQPSLHMFAVYKKMETPKMEEIVARIDELRLVGGAYAMLIANPVLFSAIYSVYQRIVDCFDDDKLYCQCAFFLIRAILKVHEFEEE